ncbi:hypothetical protein AB6A40_003870 [Gnathostoma spinigerum]|uniref:Uncharacterized protein n=1 Tax=Gnathostoma spinigerum TaxID=75299 RepID=A0ABD6ED88_9BILA
MTVTYGGECVDTTAEGERQQCNLDNQYEDLTSPTSPNSDLTISGDVRNYQNYGENTSIGSSAFYDSSIGSASDTAYEKGSSVQPKALVEFSVSGETPSKSKKPAANVKNEVTPPLIDLDTTNTSLFEKMAPLSHAAKTKGTVQKPVQKKKDWDDDAWDVLNN